MPDICLCYGEGCHKQQTCYRAQAVPSQYRQSYFVESPVDTEGNCSYYSPILCEDIVKE